MTHSDSPVVKQEDGMLSDSAVDIDVVEYVLRWKKKKTCVDVSHRSRSRDGWEKSQSACYRLESST